MTARAATGDGVNAPAAARHRAPDRCMRADQAAHDALATPGTTGPPGVVRKVSEISFKNVDLFRPPTARMAESRLLGN